MTDIFLTHNRSALHHYFGEKAFSKLQALGNVSFNDSENPTTSADIIKLARDCHILVSFRTPAVDSDLIRQLPRLAAICRVAVDIRNIDIDYASHNGILVMRASPGFGPAVSEWVIGAMISLARGMTAASRLYQSGVCPEPVMGKELRGSTLGIIGHGTIGRYLAQLGTALGMEVLVTDPNVHIDHESIEQVEIEDLLTRADFVVCLAPAMPETYHLIDLDKLAKMQPSAYFINASRSDLVNEDDLLNALENNIIAGCALDVGSAPDQMPAFRLATHPKVLATPHIGGLTPAATEHQAMDTVKQIEQLLSGTLPEGCVNPTHGRRAQTEWGSTIPCEQKSNATFT